MTDTPDPSPAEANTAFDAWFVSVEIDGTPTRSQLEEVLRLAFEHGWKARETEPRAIPKRILAP